MERVVDKLFEVGEKTLLVIIASLTLVAVAIELITLGSELKLELADLLLLFIYLEVFGMAVVYYRAQTLPVTLPVLIAITWSARCSSLRGEDFEPSSLVFEAGAIFLLAIAYGVLTWANSKSQKLKAFIADED